MKRFTILVVDDDSAVRLSLNLMLKRAGYEVILTRRPKEAIEYVRHEEPSLILMDMNFTLSTSGEEGLTLLRQVRIFRPSVPVILMTAWGSIQLAVQGMRGGAFDFITKTPPVTYFIKKAAGLTSASKEPGKTKVGKITMAQVRQIAEQKMSDLNAHDVDAASQMIIGSARSMGIDVVEG